MHIRDHSSAQSVQCYIQSFSSSVRQTDRQWFLLGTHWRPLKRDLMLFKTLFSLCKFKLPQMFQIKGWIYLTLFSKEHVKYFKTRTGPLLSSSHSRLLGFSYYCITASACCVYFNEQRYEAILLSVAIELNPEYSFNPMKKHWLSEFKHNVLSAFLQYFD